MKARVLVRHINMQGNIYDVHEVVGNRVTLKIPTELSQRLMDFNLNEVEILMEGRTVSV